MCYPQPGARLHHSIINSQELHVSGDVPLCRCFPVQDPGVPLPFVTGSGSPFSSAVHAVTHLPALQGKVDFEPRLPTRLRDPRSYRITLAKWASLAARVGIEPTSYRGSKPRHPYQQSNLAVSYRGRDRTHSGRDHNPPEPPMAPHSHLGSMSAQTAARSFLSLHSCIVGE